MSVQRVSANASPLNMSSFRSRPKGGEGVVGRRSQWHAVFERWWRLFKVKSPHRVDRAEVACLSAAGKTSYEWEAEWLNSNKLLPEHSGHRGAGSSSGILPGQRYVRGPSWQEDRWRESERQWAVQWRRAEGYCFTGTEEDEGGRRCRHAAARGSPGVPSFASFSPRRCHPHRLSCPSLSYFRARRESPRSTSSPESSGVIGRALCQSSHDFDVWFLFKEGSLRPLWLTNCFRSTECGSFSSICRRGRGRIRGRRTDEGMRERVGRWLMVCF